MKKFIVSIILLLTVNLAHSQEFDIGVKLGYNSSLSFSSLSSDLSYNHKNVFAELWNNFHIGAYGRVYFDKIYVQPELLYSRVKKEYTTLLPNGIGSYASLIKINALDVPVLVGYKIFNIKMVTFRAFAGPVFRFNIGSSVDSKNLSNEISLVGLKDDFKKARVGLQGGVGVDVFAFSLDVRYNLIGKMYEISYEDVTKKSMPSSTFIFSLGWKIF